MRQIIFFVIGFAASADPNCNLPVRVENANELAVAVQEVAPQCNTTVTVVVAASLLSLTSALVVNDGTSVLIRGATGAETLVASSHTNLFVVKKGGRLSLHDLTLSNGTTVRSGGCIEAIGATVAAVRTRFNQCRSDQVREFPP